VLARSVAAHGGDRLSSWRTLAITGTMEMEDGITYKAAYHVLAKAPDKLRVEQDMTVDLGGRLSYGWTFGPPRAGGGGAGGQQVVVAMGGGPGAGTGGTSVTATQISGGPSDKRYRLDFYVSGQNLLNRTNYTAFSGVLTSPLFGDPIAAAQARRLQAGLRFGF
jgi:hypothetical protein